MDNFNNNFKKNWFIYLCAGIFAFLFACLANKLIFRYEALGLILSLAIGAISFLLMVFLKNPVIGLLLITFFLPFERIPSMEVAGISVRINHLLIPLTFIAYIISGLALKNFKFNRNPFLILLGLFILSDLISYNFAGDSRRAIMIILFTIFSMILYILVVNLIQTENILKKVILVLFLTTFLQCIFGIYQFLGDLAGLPASLTGIKAGYSSSIFGFARIHATALEPLYFASFLFIPMGILLSLFFSKTAFIKKFYLNILIILILVNFILTVSRGAYLGFAVMIVFLAVFVFRRLLTLKNIFLTLFSAAFILSAVYLFLAYAEPKALDEFTKHIKISDYSAGESVQGRLKDYQSALKAYQKNQVFGIGPGNFGPYVKNYPSVVPKSGWPIVNNQYLETLAENGLAGLIILALLYLGLIIRSFIAYFKAQDLTLKAIMLGLLAAFIAILVQYNFFSTIYIIHIWFLMGLMVAVQDLIFYKK